MPQHLSVEVENTRVGRLTTYNKGGTRYDITLCVPELGTDILCSDVDTGEQRQPQDAEACMEDFRNDFVHARRCIAGAVACCDKFLLHLRKHGTQESVELKRIVMRLMTNDVDRGIIEARPNDDNLFNVNVLIGVEINREQGSLQTDEWKRTWKGLDVSGATSQTARALTILSSIGPELLMALRAEQADQ